MSLVLIYLLSCTAVFGQTENCGASNYEHNTNNLRWPIPPNNLDLSLYQDTKFHLPIKFHFIRDSQGESRIDTLHIQNAIKSANEAFAPINMKFYQCGNINFIDDDLYFNTFFYTNTQIEMIDLANEYNQPNVINIYITPKNSHCGWATYPYQAPYNDHIVVKCLDDYDLFIHELGHYFNLIHTHGYYNNILTDELVDGSNCATAGDYICDTPADPNLDGQSSGSLCIYNGTQQDANGDFFEPDLSNYMSYAGFICKDNFTPQQYDRMLRALLLERTYLNSIACSIDECREVEGVFSTFKNEDIYEVVTSSTIKGYNVVQSGADIQFNSGTDVCLFPGFEAAHNSNFLAKIEGCSTPSNPIFSDYPWLAAIIDENDCCSNLSATIYTLGNYNYVYVSSHYACTSNFGQLYFEDGTPWCTSYSENYCLNYYGLSSGNVLWTCNESAKMDEEVSSNLIAENKIKIYPNPLSNQTKIEVDLLEDSPVNISIYDLSGKEVKQVMSNTNLTKGEHTFNVDATDLKSGTYLCNVKSKEGIQSKKIIILK